MTIDAVVLEFQARLQELHMGLGHLRSGQTVMAAIFGTSAVLFLALGLAAVSQRRIPLWYPPLSLPFAAFSARRYRRNSLAASKLSRLAAWYQRGFERMEGRWAGTGANGEDFSSSDHVFEKDLTVLGEGSLSN